MKTILSLSLALMLAATSAAIARNHGGGNPNGGGNHGGNPGPSAPSPSTPNAPAASGPTDSDGSATRTNASFMEDGVARKTASNFCVTWAKDAYCSKS